MCVGDGRFLASQNTLDIQTKWCLHNPDPTGPGQPASREQQLGMYLRSLRFSLTPFSPSPPKPSTATPFWRVLILWLLLSHPNVTSWKQAQPLMPEKRLWKESTWLVLRRSSTSRISSFLT